MSETSSLPKNRTNRPLIIGVVIVFLVIDLVGSILIGTTKTANTAAVYNIIAFNIITIWLSIFTCYFIWALRFYNINFGMTAQEWDKIDEAKELRRKGETYNEYDLAEEPQQNPYKAETFGLPNGTVRGMIAFTLLFGAIAILIASLAPQNQMKANSFLVDQFDFFKTAFLMMIAFYFGSRSLEFLKGKTGSTPALSSDQATTETSTEGSAETSADKTIYADKPNSDQKPEEAPKIKVSVAGNVTTIPMITQVKDPMAFNE